MSASKKQIQANRANAQQSTGPKTDEGKAVSSQNNTKHALYSKDIIIKAAKLKENAEEYENLVVDLFNEFRPVGRFQEQLVFKIANCLWRSQRVIRAETAHLEHQLNGNYTGRSDNYENVKTVPDDYYSKLILRYELRLDRQLTRYYRMLINDQKLHEKKAMDMLAKKIK
jgi:hypothetical protein